MLSWTFPFEGCCANTVKAPNTTLVLSSEDVSSISGMDLYLNNTLTATHRDHVRHPLYKLELVLEIAKFAASSAIPCPGIPGLPPPRVSSLARVKRQK